MPGGDLSPLQQGSPILRGGSQACSAALTALSVLSVCLSPGPESGSEEGMCGDPALTQPAIPPKEVISQLPLTQRVPAGGDVDGVQLRALAGTAGRKAGTQCKPTQ